ncbi:hypothetical protein [Gordonia amicalis]|uniref:hypothetical protein n=1 Tax=Gordonia amicalis TaxID=89053 RepID=UPI0024BBD877|nr:hypothetical protein [Gordonia amicalis]MDJ0455478.1 hypothetical protein [Gordonia amicalis]MDV7078942.1 hypothetical protein [Gordonia amicalis]
MADPLNALTLDHLVAIIPEIIVALRNEAHSMRGLRDTAVAAADRLFVTVYRLAEETGFDLTGIPTWRNPSGSVLGMRSATRPIHVRWILDDLADKVRGTSDEMLVADVLRWAVRRTAVVSRDVRSILVSELEAAAMAREWDRFAEIRQGNRGSAGV